MQKKTEVSCGIIPLSNHKDIWKIFLVKHANGDHWGFPKGKQQDNESHKSAAVRELKEETNLSIVKLLTQTPLKETYHFYKNHQEINKTVYYYIALVEGSVELQEVEIAEGNWFLMQDALKLITFDESKFIFSQVQEFIRNIHS